MQINQKIRKLAVVGLLTSPIFLAGAAQAFIQVIVHKGSAVGSISGGDGGQGIVATGGAIEYCWSLPVERLMETASHSKQEVMRSLSNTMMAIGSVAMTTSQSIPLDAAADYDGDQICIGGTGLGTGASRGQLQVLGQSINLSSVNDPNFANLSWLPTGTYGAQPIPGQTTGHVTIVIVD
ncbi:MAG: hypothetical protein ABJ059_10045 [Hyphomicrobiales bacterium]